MNEDNISFTGQSVTVTGRNWQAPWPVKQATLVDDKVVLLYDYMAGPKHRQFRNLEGFSLAGECLWTAEHPGSDTTDVYVEILSSTPLIVWNFAGFRCTIDPATGHLIESTFAK